MQIWRPAQRITIKALGLHWREGRLLASEVRDDAGTLKGIRPLGGHVEFGERWQDTLCREFREELGIAVTITGAPIFLENIYRHEDMLGHEMIIAAEIEFPNGAYAGVRDISFREDNDTEHVARWYGVDELLANDIALFPNGLFETLFGVR